MIALSCFLLALTVHAETWRVFDTGDGDKTCVVRWDMLADMFTPPAANEKILDKHEIQGKPAYKRLPAKYEFPAAPMKYWLWNGKDVIEANAQQKAAIDAKLAKKEENKLKADALSVWNDPAFQAWFTVLYKKNPTLVKVPESDFVDEYIKLSGSP